MRKILAILGMLGLSTLALAQTACPTCPPIVSMPPGSSFYIIAQGATSTAAGPYRIYTEAVPQAGDSVTVGSAKFASTVPLSAGLFTTVGQEIHIKAFVEIAVGVTNMPAVGLNLDGTVTLIPATGNWSSTSPITSAREYQEDYWIVVTAIGTSGSIEVHGIQRLPTQNTITNQVNESGNITPSSVTVPFDTTVAHTIGFGTGTSAFTGTVQQRDLSAQFWP